MIPSVRLATHEINNLTEKHYRDAKIKRLNQVNLYKYFDCLIALNNELVVV